MPPGAITAYLAPAVPHGAQPSGLRHPRQGSPSPEKFNGRFPGKWPLPATPRPKASLSPLPLKPLVLDGCHRLCFQKLTPQDFPGGPVATSLRSQHRGPGATPGQGTRPCTLQLRAGTAKEKELTLCLQTCKQASGSQPKPGRKGRRER